MWTLLLFVVVAAVVGLFVYALIQWAREPVPDVSRTEEWEAERREVARLKRGQGDDRP